MATDSKPSIPTTYDSLFKKYGAPDIPVAYLRALAMMESNFNPQAFNKPSSGLMQISTICLKDFNQLNSTKVQAKDLFDPKTSIRIGTWLIRRIIQLYKKKSPGLMEPKWDDPKWVALLTLGWTAGWGAVADYIAALRSKIPDTKIDMDAVIALAQVKHPKSNIYAKPSPGPYMSDPKLRTWVLKVVQKYFRELGTDPLMPGNEIPASTDATVPGPGKFIVGVAIVGTLGWAIWEAVTAVTPGAAPSQGEVAKHEAKASL